jgi:hypothetical protein
MHRYLRETSTDDVRKAPLRTAVERTITETQKHASLAAYTPCSPGRARRHTMWAMTACRRRSVRARDKCVQRGSSHARRGGAWPASCGRVVHGPERLSARVGAARLETYRRRAAQAGKEKGRVMIVVEGEKKGERADLDPFGTQSRFRSYRHASRFNMSRCARGLAHKRSSEENC